MAEREDRISTYTSGQVAWILQRSVASLRDATVPTIYSRLRYWMLSGVPFENCEIVKGTGHDQIYKFEHLIEVVITGRMTDLGFKPRHIALILGDNREALRRAVNNDSLYRPPHGTFYALTITPGTGAGPAAQITRLFQNSRILRAFPSDQLDGVMCVINLSLIVRMIQQLAHAVPACQRGRPQARIAAHA